MFHDQKRDFFGVDTIVPLNNDSKIYKPKIHLKFPKCEMSIKNAIHMKICMWSSDVNCF